VHVCFISVHIDGEFERVYVVVRFIIFELYGFGGLAQKCRRTTASNGFTNTLLFLLIVLILKDNRPNVFSVSNNRTVFSLVLHTATNVFSKTTI